MIVYRNQTLDVHKIVMHELINLRELSKLAR